MSNAVTERPDTVSVYQKCEIWMFTNEQICRGKGFTFYECVNSNIPLSSFISLIIGKSVYLKLKEDREDTYKWLRVQFRTVMAAIKQILDDKHMQKLAEELKNDYDWVTYKFYLAIFDKITDCFDLNFEVNKEIRIFIALFFFTSKLDFPAITWTQFRSVFENLDLSAMKQTLIDDKEFTELLLARITWFLFRIAGDTIRVTINANEFINGDEIRPLKFKGVQAFEQLAPFNMSDAGPPYYLNYKSIFPLPTMHDNKSMKQKSFADIIHRIVRDNRVELELQRIIKDYLEHHIKLLLRCENGKKMIEQLSRSSS